MSGRASCLLLFMYNKNKFVGKIFISGGYVPPSILVLLYLQNHGAVNVFLKDGVT